MSDNRCPKVTALSCRLRRFAKEGPAKFKWFLATDEFAKRFNEVPPHQRRRAIQAIAEAEAIVHDGLPPPVKPQRMGDGRRRWTPAALARLAQAYAKANGDHEKAARIFRCTTGAARLAKQRYLDVATPLSLAA